MGEKSLVELIKKKRKESSKGKTLFLYEGFGEGTFFFELEGDYSYLHDAFINDSLTTNKQADELNKLLFHPKSGEVKVEKLIAPTKDWTWFVHCGFIP